MIKLYHHPFSRAAGVVWALEEVGEPYELVWRTVPTRLYPDSTEWALRLRREGGRTTIEQTFQVVKGSMLEPIYATVLPAHRDRTEALKHDLERIGELAQHEHAPGLSAA